MSIARRSRKTSVCDSSKKAKELGFYGVHFLADERLDFPKGWYEKLGFEVTNWVEYEAHMSEIKFELLD